MSMGKGDINEIKGLLNEYWAEVYRAGRKIQLHGPMTVNAFSGAITHELSLGPRDFPVLHKILSNCVSGENDEVDVAKLRVYVSEADRVVEGDDEWKERCGLVKMKNKQRAATAGARRKYEIENHGSPFAIAGDAKATLRLQQADRQQKHQHILETIKSKAKNGFISRQNLKRIALEHLDVSETNVDDLLAAIDPKRTGSANVDIFCEHFLPELMKPKSLRRSVLPVIAEPNQSARSPRLASPRGASPRKQHRPLTGAQQTRASKLRQSVGVDLRKYNEADTMASDWITRRSTSPRGAAARASANNTTPRKNPTVIPNPPKRDTPGLQQFKRVSTEVKRDGILMGNIPSPRRNM